MSKSHLPFALSRLEIIDFQGIKHLIIDNLPTDKQWIFITGDNAFGKTSILKAIAKGLVGDEESIDWLPASSQIYVSGYNWNQPFFQAAKSKCTTDNDFQIAAYGVSRLRMTNIDLVDVTQSKVSKKTYSLFKDDVLLNIERALIDTEKEDPSTFKRLTEIFFKMIPRLAKIECKLINKRKWVLYYEQSESGEIYEPVFFHQLAAGYRSILTMVGDMILRLSEHPNNYLEDLQGIVLIDEFDAHLHPKYQYDLPHLLSEIFPKIQFIVATHSPLPILGAKPNTAIVLTVHRNKKDGVTVERLDDNIEVTKLHPNALLTSDIFGFHNLFARDATPDSMDPFDRYEDIKKMKDTQKLLELKGAFKKLNIKN